MKLTVSTHSKIHSRIHSRFHSRFQGLDTPRIQYWKLINNSAKNSYCKVNRWLCGRKYCYSRNNFGCVHSKKITEHINQVCTRITDTICGILLCQIHCKPHSDCNVHVWCIVNNFLNIQNQSSNYRSMVQWNMPVQVL